MRFLFHPTTTTSRVFFHTIHNTQYTDRFPHDYITPFLPHDGLNPAHVPCYWCENGKKENLKKREKDTHNSQRNNGCQSHAGYQPFHATTTTTTTNPLSPTQPNQTKPSTHTC